MPLMLLIAFSCAASAFAQQPTEDQALTALRVQLRWRHQFQFAGYYAAIEKGYFRAEGLAVELVEGQPGLDPVQELLAGKVDFAIESPGVLIKRQQGYPLVVMAAIFQHSPMVIITRRDSGLVTPQSLKGKRIMLTADRDPESLAMLVEEGIALNSVAILPHNWGLDDLVAGRVDGQTAYLTNEPYLLEKAGVGVTTIQPLSYGIDFYGDCIVTTENAVRMHLEQHEAFQRAVRQGWQYAMAHPREIAELIHNRYTPEKDLESLLYEAEKMQWSHSTGTC